MRVCYLVQLVELFPLLLCTAASNRGDVQHAVTEFNECPPVKHYNSSHYISYRTTKPFIQKRNEQ